MKKVFIVVFVSAVLVFGQKFLADDCFAAGKDSVLFYAGFNASIKADKAKGSPEGEPTNGDGPYFGPGKRGQALVSGDTEGCVNYEIEKNLNKDRGSIEFWVYPIDWKGADDKFHVFFEAKDPGWLLIYKYYAPGSGLFLISEASITWSTAAQDFSKLRPGRWYHLAATWDKYETCFYLNGKPSGKTKDPQIPKELTGRFYVGDQPWHITRNNRSLIDELYIYDRPLNGKEVNWAYEHVLGRNPGEDIPGELSTLVYFDVRPVPEKNEIQVNLRPGERVDMDDFTGKIWLEPGAGTKEAQIKKTGDGVWQAIIKYSELLRGDYNLLAKIQDRQGNDVGTDTFVLKNPGTAVWMGNKTGITDTPPVPFTAIKMEGKDSISCWGRTYVLGDLGLPSKIKSAGEELFSAPAELEIISNGSSVLWKEQVLAKTEESKVRLQLKNSATSSIGTISWVCTAEYDGTIRYDIDLQPSPNASIEKMELVFHLKPEHSGLYHVFPVHNGAYGDGGATPEGSGVVVKDKWKAYWWLGDEERGLCGFCESDQAWDKIDRPDGFYIRRNPGSIDVVWSFIDGEHKLDKPWKFSFGVQATPVKYIAGWHKYRLEPGVNATVNILWTTPGLMKYFGYPESGKTEQYKKIVEDNHKKGKKVIPYSCILWLSGASPEWAFYGKGWGNGMMDAGSADVVAYDAAFMGVTPNQKWIDFIVWANNRYVREFDLDGLYHDWTMVLPSTNQIAGCGYMRDGELRPTYPFFMTREVYKRIYAMLKEYGREKGKDMFMMGHMSGQMAAPILGFCDAYLDGEHFNGKFKKDYTGILPLGYIRSEFMGSNYGVMPYFLPVQKGVTKKITNELVGLMLIHDFDLWAIWCKTEEVNKAYKVLDEFGYADAEFTGYWKNSGLVSVREESKDTVKCSFYRKPKAGALICVANLIDEPCTATLVVEWDKLKSQSQLSVIDAVSKEDINIQGKNLAVGIGPLGYRILWVK